MSGAVDGAVLAQGAVSGAALSETATEVTVDLSIVAPATRLVRATESGFPRGSATALANRSAGAEDIPFDQRAEGRAEAASSRKRDRAPRSCAGTDRAGV